METLTLPDSPDLAKRQNDERRRRKLVPAMGCGAQAKSLVSGQTLGSGDSPESQVMNSGSSVTRRGRPWGPKPRILRSCLRLAAYLRSPHRPKSRAISSNAGMSWRPWLSYGRSSRDLPIGMTGDETTPTMSTPLPNPGGPRPKTIIPPRRSSMGRIPSAFAAC